MKIVKMIKSVICQLKGHELTVAQCPVTKFKSKVCMVCQTNLGPDHKKMRFL
jgi:hypothetical protein